MFNMIYFFEAKIRWLIPCIISSDFFNIIVLDHTLLCFLIYIFTQMVVLITTCSSIHILVNSWLPSETIWWHRSGSTLAQVMVCCLKAPSHCLNLCWLVRNVVWPTTWWRHQMETVSLLLAICAGNSPVPGEFHAQRPVTRSFDVFFDLRLNKRLRKQSWGWWFETLLQPLWHHCNETTSKKCWWT